jgi:CheY-like chemotaxis protein
MLVVETLEDQGHRVAEAGDPDAALRIIMSDARIDLLATDLGLPGMDGRQLAGAARRIRPSLKVLYLTGHAHAPVGADGEPGAGARGSPGNGSPGNGSPGNGSLDDGGPGGGETRTLTKPFAVEALVATVGAMLDLGT